jgi:GNAT superfamily N-acetyltransferase
VLIESLTFNDLPQVSSLQPEGWPSITPSYQFYLQSSFCFPLKLSADDQLLGIGTTILHQHTAWLAHIIVSPQHRNKGLGTQITKALIQIAEKYYCKTILLIATTLGEPVYTKLGFRKELDYIFLSNGHVEKPSDEATQPFHEKYQKQMLALDKSISGEDRHKLLMPHLQQSRLIINHEHIEGFFLPTLGEGLVVADNTSAGLTLLTERLRLTDRNRIALPESNQDAIQFLKTMNYCEFLKGSRMCLGEELIWQPSKIFSRIGGNLG